MLTAEQNNFEALHLLGLLKHRQGRLNEALVLLVRAAHARPQEAVAHFNKGVVLSALQQHDEALASYDMAIALKPDYADALKERARWLRARARPAEALAALDKALAVTPNDAVTQANRGLILRDLQRFEAALAAYASALAIKPDHIEARVSRGDIFHRLHRYEEAVAEYDCALALLPEPAPAIPRPLFATAAVNRGVALRHLDRPQDALASFVRAQALAPNMPQAPYNLAQLQLANGDFENGWRNYEARWRGAPELKPRDFAQPQWRGEDLTNKIIYLHAEQGFGDFAPVPALSAAGAGERRACHSRPAASSQAALGRARRRRLAA